MAPIGLAVDFARTWKHRILEESAEALVDPCRRLREIRLNDRMHELVRQRRPPKGRVQDDFARLPSVKTEGLPARRPEATHAISLVRRRGRKDVNGDRS